MGSAISGGRPRVWSEERGLERESLLSIIYLYLKLSPEKILIYPKRIRILKKTFFLIYLVIFDACLMYGLILVLILVASRKNKVWMSAPQNSATQR